MSAPVDTIADHERGLPKSDAVPAISALRAGCPVGVYPDEHDMPAVLIFPAALATTELMAFMVRHCSGFVCVAMPAPRCDELELPPQHRGHHRAEAAAPCVTVDAATGIGTGISAADRARTAALLADPSSAPGTFHRPGHVVPVATDPWSTSDSTSLTRASVALVSAAGQHPAAVLSHLVSPDPVSLATVEELAKFGKQHAIPIISANSAPVVRG